LYPERQFGEVTWAKLDNDWFLFPHLWKIPFTAEIMMGFTDGGAWGMDEYGRTAGNPDYQDKDLHDKDWLSFQYAKREWARKRAGKALAHVEDTMREDSVGDSMMAEYLRKEGLIATE
jgi:hypothetical protein